MEQVGGRAAITKVKIDALIEIGVIIVKPGGEKRKRSTHLPDGDRRGLPIEQNEWRKQCKHRLKARLKQQ